MQYPEPSNNNYTAQSKTPEIYEITEILQRINERSAKDLVLIKEKLCALVFRPSINQEPMIDIIDDPSTALGSLRSIINHTRENADKIEEILNHLTLII